MKDTYELPISTTVAAAGDAFNRALKSFAGYDADLPEHCACRPLPCRTG